MLHLAAQGDQPYSLTFFREKGLSIYSVDYEQSTPLHWACFAGSETAIYYLQSWGSKVNAQDNVGNTPLHLAVRSAEHFPTTRSIKELLIKGASRDIKEENGLKPIDLVAEIENEALRIELTQLLKKPGFYLPCCHFKQPIQKIEPNNNTLVCFIIMVLGTYLALTAFVYPRKFKPILNYSFYRHLQRRVVPNPYSFIPDLICLLRHHSNKITRFHARHSGNPIFKVG